MGTKAGEDLLDWVTLASTPSDAVLVELVTQDAYAYAARGSYNLRVKRHAWLAMARVAERAQAAGYKTPRQSEKAEVVEMQTPFGLVYLTPSDVINQPPGKLV